MIDPSHSPKPNGEPLGNKHQADPNQKQQLGKSLEPELSDLHSKLEAEVAAGTHASQANVG